MHRMFWVCWVLWMNSLVACAHRAPSSPDASVPDDLGWATDGGAGLEDASRPPWPDNCPPPALVARIRLADGGVHEGCFPSSEGGLVQSYANCSPITSYHSGERDGCRLSTSALYPFSSRLGEHSLSTTYAISGAVISYLHRADCTVWIDRAAILGEEVEFHLMTPCVLPLVRSSETGSVVVESMRGRARVVLGPQRFDGHDASPRDCGPLR